MERCAFVLQHPQTLSYLFGAAIGLSLFVRLCLSLLRAFEYTGKSSLQSPHYWKNFWDIFAGVGGSHSDYWHPFVTGSIEAVIYPVLLVSNLPEYIGAWVGLKTVAQLPAWKKDRNTYQRFLIGNALIVVGSYLLSRCPWLFP